MRVLAYNGCRCLEIFRNELWWKTVNTGRLPQLTQKRGAIVTVVQRERGLF
jgi:hypothetical protein